MNFKEKYTKEIDSLAFSSDYEVRLKESLQKAGNKDKASITKKQKAFSLLVAVITAMIVFSVITVAEPSSHTPDATTAQFQNSDTLWEDRWKKSKKFPYESGDEKYAVSVLGIASGKFLNSCEGFSADENRDYFVTAIRSRDDASLSLKNEEFPIKLTPLIYGREPWVTNSSTLCEDSRQIEKNGVIYYLFDTTFLDSFVGKIICFAAYIGDSPSPEIFTLKESGIIYFSENYKGFGRIIELPQNLSDTHPETAEEMLSEDILSQLY